MSLEIVSFTLGPLENNTYLISDPASGAAVVVDPGFDSQVVAQEAARRGWSIQAIWLTHAHFDHIGGIHEIVEELARPLPVALHSADLPLWKQSGGAGLFGMRVEPMPDPEIHLVHGQVLSLGEEVIEVRHAPGHTPGHVVLHSAASGVVFCGDLIFYHGVGRTDLPGGSHSMLIRSIREQILSLPPATRLLSGHGPETTVEEEQVHNPFL